MTRTPVVVSYGGGDNSRAMLIEMVRLGVKPDLILFADTGGEKPETYANNAEFSSWLGINGFPGITIVRDGRRTLEQECIDAHTLPSLVFGFRSCSDKYKVRPQNKFLNSWNESVQSWRSGGKVIKLIGYHAAEAHRIKNYDDAKFIVEYPLVRWGWDQKKCISVVEATGFTTGKSSCWFCPAMRKREVLDLHKTHPGLYARAANMEENATAVTTVKGLGRNWSWRDLVQSDKEQTKFWEDLPDQMPCHCMT